MDDGVPAVVVVILCTLVAVIAAMGGCDAATARMRKEAIAAGAAYWTVDETGNTEFHWRDCKENDGE